MNIEDKITHSWIMLVPNHNRFLLHCSAFQGCCNGFFRNSNTFPNMQMKIPNLWTQYTDWLGWKSNRAGLWPTTAWSTINGILRSQYLTVRIVREARLVGCTDNPLFDGKAVWALTVTLFFILSHGIRNIIRWKSSLLSTVTGLEPDIFGSIDRRLIH